MAVAVLITGGNKGEVAQNIERARELVESCVGRVIARSSVRESQAWGEVVVGSDKERVFLNQVLVVETALEPMELLRNIHKIEKRLGRVRTGRVESGTQWMEDGGQHRKRCAQEEMSGELKQESEEVSGQGKERGGQYGKGNAQEEMSGGLKQEGEEVSGQGKESGGQHRKRGAQEEMSGGLKQEGEEVSGQGSQEGARVYQSRTMDIDILLYDDLVIKEQELEIPHPMMHRREFVLEPLSEVMPHYVHPKLGSTIEQILKKLREIEHTR